MAPEVAEVERALLALSEHDRAAVIRAGLLSLDEDADPAEPDEVDEAWRSETATRLDGVLNGTVRLGTFEQTYERFAATHPAAFA